jgi:hypothetical protein
MMWDFLTGLNPSIIGVFSGLCAFMGVAATFISADLVRRFGILKVASVCLLCFGYSERFLFRSKSFDFLHQAGAIGLLFQASLLTVALAAYWSGSVAQQSPLLFFLSLIVRILFNFLVFPLDSVIEFRGNDSAKAYKLDLFMQHKVRVYPRYSCRSNFYLLGASA